MDRPDICAIVLAGGQASRLGGGDKPLLKIGEQPILSHVLERLRQQVERVAISANGDPARFSSWGLPVLADGERQAGPLSGILAGMNWARRLPSRLLLSVAGDTPFFPADLARRMIEKQAEGDRRIAVAMSNGRVHPVFALWPAALAGDLGTFLAQSPTFSVAAFLEHHEVVTVEFAMQNIHGKPVDPFFNINTPADLSKAGALAGGDLP